ncbi:MAG: hypothetical protein ACJAVK_003676 [Akkermansiaceae bacterium]|jgi:hypothetical protein
MNQGTLLRGVALLGVIWAIVWGVTSWSSDRKATPEKVTEMIDTAAFEDWSQGGSSGFSQAQQEARLTKLDEMGEVLNQLDVRQRKLLNDKGDLIRLFFKLSKEEKLHFVDMTFTQSAERIMGSFDSMDPEERERFVERGVRDMTDGNGAEVLARLKEEDPEILKLVIQKGFKAYYQGASANTKMDLLPFMSAVGEVVQGFAKPETGL